MGNSESNYDDDSPENYPPPSYGYIGSSMSPSYPTPPLSSYAGSSMIPSNPVYASGQRLTFIPDNFSSLDQVIASLREAGLESSNLILSIDFTKSNEWTGKYSFNKRSLHAIGSTANPYEQAISIIGRTLSPFDDDNLIPCFGFGDATSHDQYVFGFYPDHRPCDGFEEALARYKELLPHLKLSGPTSFAPVIDATIDIVEESNEQNPDDPRGMFSPQEQATVNSIVNASICACCSNGDPFQYRATQTIQLKGKKHNGTRNKLLPPPREVIDHDNADRSVSCSTSASFDSVSEPTTSNEQACPICLTNPRNMAFQCGHMACMDCGPTLKTCPLCREPIKMRVRLYT
ncbi:hypothetical protein V2J09_000668 [Rumex salicifolius]